MKREDFFGLGYVVSLSLVAFYLAKFCVHLHGG